MKQTKKMNLKHKTCTTIMKHFKKTTISKNNNSQKMIPFWEVSRNQLTSRNFRANFR